MFLEIFLALLSLFASTSSQFLSVVGRNFIFNGERVHLSGVNYAWVNYGHDFGNNHYTRNGPILEQWIREIRESGGNSLSECFEML